MFVLIAISFPIMWYKESYIRCQVNKLLYEMKLMWYIYYTGWDFQVLHLSWVAWRFKTYFKEVYRNRQPCCVPLLWYPGNISTLLV